MINSDEVWQAFFFASEPAPPAVAGNGHDWNTDELLSEIVRRTHGDIPALRALQTDVLQALLNAMDRQGAEARGDPSTMSLT
jgi:hypothetical protein